MNLRSHFPRKKVKILATAEAIAPVWDDDGIQRGFAELLKLALEENWAELAANAADREAFLGIALKLASLQHPLGSELMTVAASRFAKLA